jgi:glycosidase
MPRSFYPSLYQVNTRVWLTELSSKLSRTATLDDIPDHELDKLKDAGFDWIWFLSVWQTGKTGQSISRQNPEWRKEFQETLPDLSEEDIAGSGFAITGYSVSELLGGDAALARLRNRLQERGLKLMLDFVPNHMAPDHPWISEHPDFFIRGDEAKLAKEPANYTSVKCGDGNSIFAYGRDPYFEGWPDTLQLNYGNPLLQEAMTGELIKIAGQCDGVRCDMAMLVLPDVFKKTWGISCKPFWSEAIRKVREVNSGFCFMAEVYWDMEWAMIQQGFDYAYDKRLYDRLKEGPVKPVREHLFAGLDYQGHMARFLENHDEPRAAKEFSVGKHEAAAILTFLSPGLRFFHQGQFAGKMKRISPHLVRGPLEPVNTDIGLFYDKLLGILRHPVFKNGHWQMLHCAQAWESNFTHESCISFAWQGEDDEKILVAVNYSKHKSQCYVKFPFNDLGKETILLHDMVSDITYERNGEDLQTKGLYLDEPAWKAYVFTVRQQKG